MSGREAFEETMRVLGFDHPDREYLGAMMQIAWAVWQASDAELAAKDARIAELEAELRKILDLISESKGVAGFHLNGELAEWDYFDLPQTIEGALR